ncbi:MAG TPA: deoxyribose-phosphate aldolase [Bacteriovoracaceae bacterium]|nr:deoxyribose-phosphate aldolase [Bacteriovoracaceae bacterium]
MTLNKYIDHTLLKADATAAQIEKLCLEAREHAFASVCINSYFVKAAVKLLEGCPVKVCTVVGFPLGASTMETKRFEAMKAVADGSREIDMVMNISAAKSRDWQYVFEDMSSLVKVCHHQGAIVKVILETSLLNLDEKIRACELAVKAQVDFVKTSTGFANGGAATHDVKLMRSIVGFDIGVKASGGIRDAETAKAMIEAGATRLGTSASVEIVKGQTAKSGY